MALLQTNSITANQAVACIAFKTNEICSIYPITPASGMAELAEEWSAAGYTNVWENTPVVYQLQSEAGAAGTMHGALQTGALATTFTASQGLLLMMPNMFKIAGQLLPNVIHVATRSIATHALSVFGDHSDVMAVRSTGYAMLSSSSVQESMDMALIAQVATLVSKVPFVHFFDGFRTSHETNTISLIEDKVIKQMMPSDAIEAHKDKALSFNNPTVRGSAQGPEIFFQGRERINTYYNECPKIVSGLMEQFKTLTGRSYKPFEFIGDPDANHVIISMASSTSTIAAVVHELNRKGKKLGLINVRLYRPFSAEYLVNAIPTTCKSIAVLDRTKEPGASGEPLYLDVLQALTIQKATVKFTKPPKVYGGRYGLSSKEFNPAMVHAIYKALETNCLINNFTVGINDDVTNLSLKTDTGFQLQKFAKEFIIYEDKSTTDRKSLSQLFQELNNRGKNIQAYTECSYKKSETESVCHLRVSDNKLEAPYLIDHPDVILCDSLKHFNNERFIELLHKASSLIINTKLDEQELLQRLTSSQKQLIKDNNIAIYSISENDLQQGFLTPLHHLVLEIFKTTDASGWEEGLADTLSHISLAPSEEDVPFTGINHQHLSLTEALVMNKGNQLSVGDFPANGSYQINDKVYGQPRISEFIPVWEASDCIQCGACTMSCPQAALRMKVFQAEKLPMEVMQLNSVEPSVHEWKEEDFQLTIQVNPDQCNGCNNCIDSCPVKALIPKSDKETIELERVRWELFDQLPEFDRSKIDVESLGQQQLQEPLFRYPYGVEGCGEAPYLKLLAQLFGDRMLVANATGASSIIGGALPQTPWYKNNDGRGPAWANSLFEDNAEFGLGFRLTYDFNRKKAEHLLRKLKSQLNPDLVEDLLSDQKQSDKNVQDQRTRINNLKEALQAIESKQAKDLFKVADYLLKPAIWIVGGDGWAYDIGYGGLDHVVASGENVNILILDNEVYDNTGGQMSKATPFGASAKFASKGKYRKKKDLGLMLTAYEDVYIASVSIGADKEQTLQAFLEAESYDGPSVIIAYCHSVSQEVDMKHPSQYHKAKVASGQWLLYRFDPRNKELGESPMILDSKITDKTIENYLKMEGRFDNLLRHKDAGNLVDELQRQQDQRYVNYLRRTSILNNHSCVL
ncbi:pyruvate-ferredoxin/flavodoxin oxidoreductase [Zhouia amylolytica]|uniref:Pyruvate-ferredoxin/flavodoxin oxidoreductase n=1 Tax=Zhouia amylolytica TaxID=376730 RepID=A0A1I6QU30_9FLAO|nr:4Fe-4S binding protein [Zhouia amylolytica]SFS55929.1 pyruvate-ferredoxin/flavodoxin oxidoreductase [Zhouia amylolytica]